MKINLSVSLAGQAVGVKEVDHGIWLVSFMEYDLGYVDLEEKTSWNNRSVITLLREEVALRQRGLGVQT